MTRKPQTIIDDAAPGKSRRRWMLVGSLLLTGLAWLVSSRGWLPGAAAYLPQTVLVIGVMYLIAVGADWLVDSSSAIARAMGVSDLVIGLTVVAFGTSAPEMAASLVAGFQGKGDITIANVVGSNVFNICFILGGVALLVKGGLHIDRELLVRDGPVLLTGTVLLFLFVGANPFGPPPPPPDPGTVELFHLLNLRLEFLEGAILMTALVVYLYALYRVLKKARKEQKRAIEAGEKIAEEHADTGSTLSHVPMLLLGLAFVVGGCHLLVGHGDLIDGQVQGFGALWFARMWEIPDYVVGVTIIAAGTSAPEFVVSLVAASRGAYGISAGNLLGSDIFNMFGVVGLAGLILQPPLALPVTVSAAVVPSLLALSGVIVVTIFFMWTGRRVARSEGLILIFIGVGRWVLDFMSRG